MKAQPHASHSSNTSLKIPNFLLNEASGKYEARRALSSDQIIKAALKLVRGSMNDSNPLTSPQHTRQYIALTLGTREQEVFACVWLNTKHRVIKMEELFYGTIDGATVYPREVVKRALILNAAAVIAVHNHPSGETKPSRSDEHITQQLKNALALVDVRLIDHLIVGGTEITSLAECGLV